MKLFQTDLSAYKAQYGKLPESAPVASAPSKAPAHLQQLRLQQGPSRCELLLSLARIIFLLCLLLTMLCALFQVLRAMGEPRAEDAGAHPDVAVVTLLHRGAGPARMPALASNDTAKDCLLEYYYVFGIDSNATLPAYKTFFEKLRYNFDHLHTFALEIICLAQNELEQCMGQSIESETRLSIAAYQQMFGIGIIAAREYAGDLRVRSYECANKQFLRDHFDCIHPTLTTKKAELEACTAEMDAALKRGDEKCGAMDGFISCSRGIYGTECGADVSKYVCNIIETAFLFNFPTCSQSFQMC